MNIKNRFCLLTLTVLCLFTRAGIAQEESTAKLQGLLVTGGCCHDYDRQKLIITEGLSQRVNIEWDIPETAETGEYRIVHHGNRKSFWFGRISEYRGQSRKFTIN